MKNATDQEQRLENLSDSELLEQTMAQYKAVAQLAASLATVHSEISKILHFDLQWREILATQCVRSAEIMNTLGDILDAMDANDEEKDAWMKPVFEKANHLLVVRV